MAYSGVEDGWPVKYPNLPDHVLTDVLLQPSYLRGKMLRNGSKRATIKFPSPPRGDIGHGELVLLRACYFRERRSIQKECLPIGTEMWLNGSYLPLDSEKPLPLDITNRSVGRNIDNRLKVVFSPPRRHRFYVAVMIYRKQPRYPTSSQLTAPSTNGSENGGQSSMTLNLSVTNLTRKKGRAFVKTFFEKQRRVSGVSTNNIEVSLLCPISRTRLAKACRGSLCKHLQCFDEEKFKQTTAGKLLDDIKCPICHRRVSGLVADDFMQQLLKEAADDCTAVVFQPDASWAPVMDETDLSFVDLTQDRSVNCSKDGPKQDEKDNSVIDLTGV